MKKKLKNCLLSEILLVIVTIYSTSVHAKYISPEISFNSYINDTNKKVFAVVSIINKGDESAYSLQPVLSYINTTLSGALKISLMPNENHTWNFFIDLPRTIEGKYPLIINTYYQDVNGHKFSAISLHDIALGKALPSAIVGKTDDINIYKDGFITLKIKNTDRMSHNLTVTLLLPKDISSDKPTKKIFINPNEEINLKFKIWNFSALKDSTYNSYLLLEYDNNSYHFLEYLKTNIYITDKESRMSYKSLPLNRLVLLLSMTLLLFTGIYIYKQLQKHR